MQRLQELDCLLCLGRGVEHRARLVLEQLQPGRVAREVKSRHTRMEHAAQVAELEAAGWTALTVWECEIEDAVRLLVRLRAFLGEAAGWRR